MGTTMGAAAGGSRPASIVIVGGEIEYRDVELDDPRLDILFEFGMPEKAIRMLITYGGEFFEPKYRDYALEVLGISDGESANPAGDIALAGGVTYYRGWDAQPKLMHHWMERLRCVHTVVTIDRLWHPRLVGKQ